jgi:hypothetical protein
VSLYYVIISLYYRYREGLNCIWEKLLWNLVIKGFVSLKCLKLFWDDFWCSNISRITCDLTKKMKTSDPPLKGRPHHFWKAVSPLYNVLSLVCCTGQHVTEFAFSECREIISTNCHQMHTCSHSLGHLRNANIYCYSVSIKKSIGMCLVSHLLVSMVTIPE